jgi:hypothetical protein
MTAERRKKKQYRARFAVFACLASVLSAVADPARGGLTERIVVDWHTGLAISGYDPVAFFTDGKPVAGRADLELRYGGVVWRFSNVGNRAAFAERPEVYMPRYGGYDPVGIARGVAVAGNPEVWIIAGERLFLFYDNAERDKFAADSARFIASSERKWPGVMSALTP